MTKSKKRMWIVLIVAVAAMLVSMVGTALTENNFFKTERTEYNVTTQELAEMIRENNQQTGKNIEMHFIEATSGNFHFRLFVPKTATAENPAPAVVCAHGGTNVLELQMPFYIELARRGFVVASIDMPGEGETDVSVDAATNTTKGMIAAVEYLMSLPMVDENNVGVTGHSFGNQACINTVAILNTPGSTQRIKAWVDGDGLRYLPSMTPEMAEGLYMTVGVAKYGETNMPNGYQYLSGDAAKTLVKNFYPDFADDALKNGQWYSAQGPVGEPGYPDEETTLDTGYKGTHPMWHFTTYCSSIAVNGFYTTLGIPSAAGYIPSERAIWPIEVCFELLGLFGFFAMLFPLVSLLAGTKIFSRASNPVAEKDTLPPFKDWRVAIITLVTMGLSVAFAFFTYTKITSMFDPMWTTAPVNPASYPSTSAGNEIGLWTIGCGLFTVAMILLNYGAQWVLCRDRRNKLGNPFGSAALHSVSQFFTTLLFAGVVVLLMYVPVIIASFVFHADFRICTLAVQVGDIERMPMIITRYIPMWLMFYVPYAIVNSNTRFKDMPEWLSVTLSAVSNCLSIVLILAIQYYNIFTKGTVMPYNAMGGLIGFTLVPVLAFASVSSRYIYKKTGNAWLAGIINATIFCLMMIYGNNWGTDMILL